jgi:hypothetical protein
VSEQMVTPTVTEPGVAEWHRKNGTAIYRFAKALVEGRMDAPGGTRTHGLTPKGNSENLPLPPSSPMETAGNTPVLPPKSSPKRPRNRNNYRNTRGGE